MRRTIGLLFALMIFYPLPALAQVEGQVGLEVLYPGVVVEPGDQATFDLEATSTTPRQLELRVDGLPEGWTATFRGGGSDISRVTADSDPTSFDLNVDVPADAAEGSYRFRVVASDVGADLAASVDLEIVVRAGAGGEVVLTPDFPGLRGPADATFTFRVEVRNDTPQEVQLELDASGPEGWRVTARPTTEEQAATITVDAGGTQRVNVEARPPVNAEAGNYEVVFRVRGDGIEEELPLTVQIIGDVALELTTPDQRLNTTVTAGQPSQFTLVVFNTGTALLQGVELSATPPRNWEVTFEPEVIPEIAPGQSANVTATITPASDAIAGDYRITFRASVDQAEDSVEVRATVNPSAVWGLVGVAVIALTLGGLGWVFRTYGRR
ncbi:MAG: ABC transporter substrate-binding protein [Acidimicrobiia bacterium]|nr:MAG: ABC transporter substrate-binding protein [Acidimicrobiia bacterium]